MFFQENGQYRCAVYLRLSRSDGDQQESNSIKNQRALLNDYMGKHPELHKVDEYVDDGYSGTNFERPDFKRMMRMMPLSAKASSSKYSSCWNWTLVPHHRRQQFIHYQVFCAVQTAGRI